MAHRRRGRLPAVLLAVSCTLACAIPATAGIASADEPVRHSPPVDAPVVDGFRAPPTRFGAGNRGLTYDLPAGTLVRASAPGTVVFAGVVAATRHVTVLHDDGLRTSYSFLADVGVRRGQRVDAGDVVGTAGTGFHFGVRDGDRYLDPATLFGTVEVRVRLVPHDEPLPPSAADVRRERDALLGIVRERGLLERAVDWSRATAGTVVEGLAASVHVARQLEVSDAVFDAFVTFVDGLDEPCTPPTAPLDRPAPGRTALLVAGLGSDSVSASIDDVDTASLGYADGDVVRFSYAGGGRVPDAGDAAAFTAIPAQAYGPAHTFGDLTVQGGRLADLVEQVAAARPGHPVDLLAHSQGGIVSRLAVAELARRGRLGLLGVVVTMGSPHRGADLATGAVALDDEDHDAAAFVAERLGVELDTRAPSIRQMAETSDLVARLASEGVPDGVDLRTIGAAGDLVVTADKTTVDGVPSAVVPLYGPTAHGGLPGSAHTTREVALALAGRPPGCRGRWRQAVDAAVPEAVSFAENALIAAASI